MQSVRYLGGAKWTDLSGKRAGNKKRGITVLATPWNGCCHERDFWMTRHLPRIGTEADGISL